MEYRNKVTGIVMSFACPISGENWEPVKKPVPDKEPEKPKKKAVKKSGGKK